MRLQIVLSATVAIMAGVALLIPNAYSQYGNHACQDINRINECLGIIEGLTGIETGSTAVPNTGSNATIEEQTAPPPSNSEYDPNETDDEIAERIRNGLSGTTQQQGNQTPVSVEELTGGLTLGEIPGLLQDMPLVGSDLSGSTQGNDITLTCKEFLSMVDSNKIVASPESTAPCRELDANKGYVRHGQTASNNSFGHAVNEDVFGVSQDRNMSEPISSTNPLNQNFNGSNSLLPSQTNPVTGEPLPPGQSRPYGQSNLNEPISPPLGLPTVAPQSNTIQPITPPLSQRTNNTGLLISQSAALSTFEPTMATPLQNQTEPPQGNGSFYNENLVKEDETKDGWTTCDDKILLIRMQCPVGWELNIGEDNLDLEHPNDFSTYISIEIEHIFPIDSSGEYMRDTLNAERDENTIINNMEEIEINGNDASVAEYTDGSDKTKQYFIVDSDEYLGYLLEYSADQETYSNFLPVFDRVAQSFEITGAFMTNTDSELEEMDTDFEEDEDEFEGEELD